MKKITKYLYLLILLTIPNKSLIAHPHMWIDLKSNIIINENNLFSFVQQEWLFGDFSSAIIIDDINKNSKGFEFGLKEEISKIFNHLYEYNYFTSIKIENKEVKIGKVKNFTAAIHGTRIWVKFSVPLLNPIDIYKKNLIISIYDPTYYIEMLHLEGEKISIIGKNSNICNASLIKPKPSEEAITLSKSIELDMKPDSSVGKIFAEKIEVSC